MLANLAMRGFASRQIHSVSLTIKPHVLELFESFFYVVFVETQLTQSLNITPYWYGGTVQLEN